MHIVIIYHKQGTVYKSWFTQLEQLQRSLGQVTNCEPFSEYTCETLIIIQCHQISLYYEYTCNT